MDDKAQWETDTDEKTYSKTGWKMMGQLLYKGLVKLFISFMVMIGVICIIGLVLILSLLYPMEYKKTEVAQFQSPDGEYVLYMYQIGEPAWPFGSADGRFVLKTEKKNIVKLNFSVADDGAALQDCNVSETIWEEDCVKVRVTGSEQKDMMYMLYYNGETDSCMAETVP